MIINLKIVKCLGICVKTFKFKIYVVRKIFTNITANQNIYKPHV